MPKYAVHMIVLDEAINRLRASTRPDERRIGELMHRNRQVAVLGCIGPDLFFFAPDFDTIRKLYKFYENFKWVIDLYNATIGRIKEALAAIGEPVAELVETLAPATIEIIRKFIEEIRETANLFNSTLTTGLFAGVIEIDNLLDNLPRVPNLTHGLFDLFAPPLQNGESEGRWYWFDMLHYRETGRFVKNLVRLAGNDEAKLAYAYGYMTHIATDTMGHPFVNQVVGGPARMHLQRHATCENFIDSWAFYNRFGESINTGLHRKLGIPQSIPDKLVDQLYNAFITTYQDKPHPLRINTAQGGFLTKHDIKVTYEVFYFVSEVLGGMVVKPPEEPFSGVLDVLEEALERFRAPPSPPRRRRLCGIDEWFTSRECWEEFAEAIGEWLGYLGELIVWTFETILRLADFLLAALLSLPITVLMAILYGIQLALYNLYRQVRSVLVLAGLVYPEPDELQTSYGMSLITPYQCNLVHSFKTYPRVHSCGLNNLQCPNAAVEEPGTLAAFYPRDPGITPNKFIGEDEFNEDNLKAYARARNPDETRALQMRGRAIGNAVSFAYWLIANSQNPMLEDIVYADWNLDSDRGYGYKCWTTRQRLSLTTPTMIPDETYLSGT